MTTIALPSGFAPSAFAMSLRTTQRSHSSPFGGSEQVIDLLNDRWEVSMSTAPRSNDNAARVEAFIAAMRGMTNTVNLYHWRRQAPRGTMRGTPTSQTTAQGASTLLITAVAGETLLAGDMIGVAGMLFQVQSDATASGGGTITVPIVNRVRTGFASGLPVTWDKPTAPFRMVASNAQQYVPGYAEAVSMDFVEAVP